MKKKLCTLKFLSIFIWKKKKKHIKPQAFLNIYKVAKKREPPQTTVTTSSILSKRKCHNMPNSNQTVAYTFVHIEWDILHIAEKNCEQRIVMITIWRKTRREEEKKKRFKIVHIHPRERERERKSAVAPATTIRKKANTFTLIISQCHAVTHKMILLAKRASVEAV